LLRATRLELTIAAMTGVSIVAQAGRCVAIAALLLWIEGAGSARACSVDVSEPYEPSGGGSDAGIALPSPLPLQSSGVRVNRSRRAPPGHGDCSDIGSITLSFVLDDGASVPDDSGIALTVVEGELPPRLHLSGEPYAHDHGTLFFAFQDHPEQAFAFTLEARAVDAAGNQSEPTEVIVTGHPRASDGCAVSGEIGGSSALALFGATLLLMRRRR
jgi:uncharacterized protein (TIGR03382 family)